MESKNHPVYENYTADKFGNIFGPRGKTKPILHHTGYTVITLPNKQMRRHRFVWECWNGVIEDLKLVINHKNGIKTDNRLENLELVSNRENVLHAFEMGLKKPIRGEQVTSAKITNEECRELIQMVWCGYTNTEIANKFNLHPRYVSLIRHKRRWAHLWDEMEKDGNKNVQRL